MIGNVIVDIVGGYNPHPQSPAKVSKPPVTVYVPLVTNTGL